VLRGQVDQWSRAEQALAAAINALGEYLDILVVIKPLATEAIYQAQATGDWQRATEDILRWHAQLDMANHRAADVLRVATGELGSIRRLVDPTATSRPVAISMNAARQRVVHEPVVEQQSPAELENLTTVLCDALRDATYLSAEQL
jgi:hypothetical protein